MDNNQKRVQWGWYWYDFGNSAYTAVILLAVYAAYFQGTIVGGAEGTRLWGVSMGIGMLVVAFVSPVLGAIADYSVTKQRFLFFFSTISWIATSLCPARLGASLLPVGLVGLNDVFSSLKRGRRAKIGFNIGKPFGSFKAEGHGQQHREQLDEISHEIMRHIAELIPPEKHGHYSNDPAIHESAMGTEIYPWADKIEGEAKGTVH